MGRGWRRTASQEPRQSLTRQLNFKRMKSIAQLGHLPKYDDRSSRAWLYGKLLLALLTEKMIRVARTVSPWGYNLPQTAHLQPLA